MKTNKVRHDSYIHKYHMPCEVGLYRVDFFQNGCRCHGNGQNAKKLKNTKMIIAGYSRLIKASPRNRADKNVWNNNKKNNSSSEKET
jgi:hypothetical protein